MCAGAVAHRRMRSRSALLELAVEQDALATAHLLAVRFDPWSTTDQQGSFNVRSGRPVTLVFV